MLVLFTNLQDLFLDMGLDIGILKQKLYSGHVVCFKITRSQGGVSIFIYQPPGPVSWHGDEYRNFKTELVSRMKVTCPNLGLTL